MSQFKDQFFISLPGSIQVVLSPQDAQHPLKIVCDTPTAAEIILAIAENGGAKFYPEEKAKLKELALGIANRYSGHPKT